MGVYRGIAQDNVQINSGVINTARVGDGTTNYTEFESGTGFMAAHGEAQVWVDLDFPLIIRKTGVGVPALATLKGNIQAPQWQVNDFVNIEGQEMIHGWAEGTEMQWHIHHITGGTDVDDRYVKFRVEWVYALPYGQVSDPIITDSPDILIPANTPDRTHRIIEIAKVTIPSGRITTHVYARLSRIAATGAAPSADPFVTMLQAHIQMDTIGSRNITTK